MNHALQALKDRGGRLKKMDRPRIPTYSYRGQDAKDPSLDSGVGIAYAKDIPTYTGDAVLGIAVQHKSCLQPIFNEQAAKDSASMRR